MRRALISVLVVLVAGGGAAMAQTRPAGNPDPKLVEQQPMAFYVAKGPADSCGAGCSEWIAADGNIDRHAAQRLWLLLARLRDRKPPIYFQSRGGMLDEAIAIGQLLREHKLKAGVARTIPQRCAGAKGADKTSCDELKKSGQPLKARLRSAGAYCMSACVYALIGAPVREVPHGAYLGVHASKLYLKQPPEDSAQAKTALAHAIGAAKYRVLAYLREAGISSELYEIANSVPHESVRVLTRQEIARLKIVDDPVHFPQSYENVWRLRVYQDAAAAVAITVAHQAAAPSGRARNMSLRVTCAGQGKARVNLRRERDRDDAAIARPIKATAGEHEFEIPPNERKPPINSNGVRIDDRFAIVPSKFLQAPGQTIELIDRPDDSQADRKPAAALKITTLGLSDAFAALQRQCREFPPVGMAGSGAAGLRQ